MSYILDALQKNATENESPEPVEKFPGIGAPTPKPAPHTGGLALPWKLAIGAVLIANVALLLIWRTDSDRSNLPPTVAADSRPPNSTQTQTDFDANASRGKKPLPGIVSPRELPVPGASPSAGTATAANTPRTFKPTGRPITIAGEPEPGDLVERTFQPQTTVAADPPRVVQTPEPTPTQTAPPTGTSTPSNRARTASALSSLSDSARTALYALTFSFHIYGSEADLRSVGVNGQRRIEGQAVTTDNGTTFTIAEITDNGAIIEFDHEGKFVSVAIPVMEDWKDS